MRFCASDSPDLHEVKLLRHCRLQELRIQKKVLLLQHGIGGKPQELTSEGWPEAREIRFLLDINIYIYMY